VGGLGVTRAQFAAAATLLGAALLIAGFALWLGLAAALLCAGVLALALGLSELTDDEGGG
jgi:hypothetical protein